MDEGCVAFQEFYLISYSYGKSDPDPGGGGGGQGPQSIPCFILDYGTGTEHTLMFTIK
jgi:hypothetical protein